MPNKDTPYQTLNEFLTNPFGLGADPKNFEYNQKYQTLVAKKAIYCENVVDMDDGTYMVHIKIPSESQDKIFYDVVLQFFTDNEELTKSNSYSQYFIQFYSNCPSFMYQYAALYRVHGYLIEALYEKMDPEYAHTLPDKANPKYKMGYDKSIYYACKFIQDNQYTILRKSGKLFYRRVKPKQFFNSIKDFQEMKSDSELYSLEKSLKKETDKEKEKAKELRDNIVDHINPLSKIKRIHNVMKKKASTSTLPPSERGVKTVAKKKGSKVTGGTSVRVIKKKKASTSTRKR